MIQRILVTEEWRMRMSLRERSVKWVTAEQVFVYDGVIS